MKKNTLLIFFFAFFITTITTAQISTVKPDRACINCPTDTPDASAALEIQANNRGLLIPRVADTTAVLNPATGVLIYDNSDNTFKYHNGTVWTAYGGDRRKVVIGYGNQTLGEESVALGYINEAIANVSTAVGIGNIASGLSGTAVGRTNDASGFGSTAVGYNNNAIASTATTYGFENTASGNGSIAIGKNNEVNTPNSSAFGQYNMVTGDSSVVVGLRNEATGFSSSAFGYLNEATSSSSSAFGYVNETTGISSSAFGYLNKAIGNYNSAFGYVNRAVGDFSSAFGHFNETTGNSSSAFGKENDATGFRSNAFGFGTISNLRKLTVIGTHNDTTAGSATVWIPTEPVFMIGNGEASFDRSTALTILKNGNTGIGTMTPSELLEVNGKIKIGSFETIEDGGSNTISFNSNLTPTVDNQRDLGSSTLRWDDVYATNGTINTSDARQKANIQRLDYGLEQVLQLKPVKFRWKDKKEEGEKLGLIAQDLLKVLPEVVKTHDWITTEEGERKEVELENLGVYYSDIIPVLIHSIQEQQSQLEDKDEAIEDLKNQNARLEDRLHKIEIQLAQLSTLQTTKIQLENNANSNELPQLQQNQPNPFSEHTTIQYYIPETVQQAQLQFHDLNAKVLKVIEIDHKGQGQVELETAALVSGTYSYSLILDGKIFETKRMVLSR